MARRDDRRVFLYAFDLIECLIDGEAVACDHNGLPIFDWLR
jgi:hypothetical protein